MDGHIPDEEHGRQKKRLEEKLRSLVVPDPNVAIGGRCAPRRTVSTMEEGWTDGAPAHIPDDAGRGLR